MPRVLIQSGFRHSRTARLLSWTLWVGLAAILLLSLILGLSRLA